MFVYLYIIIARKWDLAMKKKLENSKQKMNQHVIDIFDSNTIYSFHVRLHHQ